MKSALIMYRMWWWVRSCPRGLWTAYSDFKMMLTTGLSCLLHLTCVTVFPHTCVFLFVWLCWCLFTLLFRLSLVQSFVGSPWIGQSRAALMSFMASYSMCIASPMWSCWWATQTCTATCCPSTMMTTTTRPSPLPVLYSGCSCRGRVSTEAGHDRPWCHFNLSF